MASKAALCLLLVLSATAHRSGRLQPRDSSVFYTVNRLSTEKPAKTLITLQVTDHVIQLERGNGSSLSTMYVNAIRAQEAGEDPTYSRALQSGSVEMIAIAGGSVFLAPVTIGGQDFRVVIDTGSSDPWLADTGFTCHDPTDKGGPPIEDYRCFFGPQYDRNASTTYERLPDRSMNLSYADGETLAGPMGTEVFTMGGITFPGQEFGLVDYAAWYGDGVSSGLIGFAYRSLTQMYGVEDPRAASASNAYKYNPFFDNLYRNNITEPIFSMALTRDTQRTGAGGVMALGGIPDIPYAPTWISSPILPVGINDTKYGGDGSTVYQFYTVTVDGFAITADQSAQFASKADALQNPRKTALRGPIGSNPNSTQVNAIVDSGTTLVYLSDAFAAEVAAAFTPPGGLDADLGLFTVPCDATPPLFGASIGGKLFPVNPADMTLQVDETTCISGVQGNRGPQGLWILGDVWMKAVLCVFDVGTNRMGFAGRQYYGMSW